MRRLRSRTDESNRDSPGKWGRWMSARKVAAALAGQVMGSTNSSFAVAEWRAEGGPPGPPRTIAPVHIHHNDDEGWYVLEGKLCVQVGEEAVEVLGGGERAGTTWHEAHLLESWNRSGSVSALHDTADSGPD